MPQSLWHKQQYLEWRGMKRVEALVMVDSYTAQIGHHQRLGTSGRWSIRTHPRSSATRTSVTDIDLIFSVSYAVWIGLGAYFGTD